ncbi:peptide methionine sulfoxide reductase [Halobacteriales archaeon QS_8_69_73]|nr:MAG: peptide methionine sulfoxide reductase [Halobacteriales archaeon QS_8_69_73]
MDLSPSVVREHDRTAPDPSVTETATFGLGCFWGPDGRFGALEGVVRTRVGYAGGTRTDPSYHALGDHTEVFQVDFDPGRTSYRALAGRALDAHDPNRQVPKTQYQNVLFAATAAQRETLATLLEERGLEAGAIGTRIERLDRFYLAEDYHQKHGLRGTPGLQSVFEELGYDDAELRESPAAAVLNGAAAGHDVDGNLGAALDGRVGPR